MANNTVHVIQSTGNRNNSANNAPPTARPPDTEDEDDDGDGEGNGGIFIAVQSGATATGGARNDEPQDRMSGAQRRLMGVVMLFYSV